MEKFSDVIYNRPDIAALSQSIRDYTAALKTAGSADDAAAVRDALADTSVTYEGVTGTFNLDESGTPVKGAAVIEFVYDSSAGGLEGLSTRLVTTISADEL